MHKIYFKFIIAVALGLPLTAYSAGPEDIPQYRENFSSPLTFREDILPILDQRCTKCHSADSGLPNWLDYPTTYASAPLIRRRVFEIRDMPMRNMTKMTMEERALVAEWVDAGAPE